MPLIATISVHLCSNALLLLRVSRRSYHIRRLYAFHEDYYSPTSLCYYGIATTSHRISRCTSSKHWHMLYPVSLGNIQEACAQGTILLGPASGTEAYNVQIRLIEDLFQVQTNPLRLFNYHLYFKTPMLVAVAMFSWLVPIATLYPPGTLVVGLQSFPIGQSFNVSVFHHRTLQDIVDKNVIAEILCDQDCMDDDCKGPFLQQLAENASLLSTCRMQGLLVDLIPSRSHHNLGHFWYMLTY